MEDALLGLAGGGTLSAASILYTIWQSRQNTKDIENIEEEMKSRDTLLDALVTAFSDFKVHVAESYVPIGRLAALEGKIDKIYEYILQKKP